MSQLNKILMIAAFLFAIQPLFAATVVVDQPAATSVQEGKVDGEKTTFRERLATKILDKKIKKAMKEDKAYKEGSGGNILSLLALIFGGASFLFIWIIGLVGILFALAGIIFGIIGLKKENSKVMAILGIVFSSITLFLLLLGILFLAALFAI